MMLCFNYDVVCYMRRDLFKDEKGIYNLIKLIVKVFCFFFLSMFKKYCFVFKNFVLVVEVLLNIIYF